MFLSISVLVEFVLIRKLCNVPCCHFTYLIELQTNKVEYLRKIHPLITYEHCNSNKTNIKI
jgi:hypothetical protein